MSAIVTVPNLGADFQVGTRVASRITIDPSNVILNNPVQGALNVMAALNLLSAYAPPVATTVLFGQVRLATAAEMTAGVTAGAAPAAVTLEGLSDFFYDTAQWANFARAGTALPATVAEMTSGAFVNTHRFVTPDGLPAFFYDVAQVATTAKNGISRQATAAEVAIGTTSGSVPAFVSPETLGGFLGNHLQYWVQNIPPSTLATLGYPFIWRNNGVSTFVLPSSFYGPTVTVGPGMHAVWDGSAWYLIENIATPLLNGVARQATVAEASAGITSGSAPAFVTPEGLAAFSLPLFPSRGSFTVTAGANPSVGGSPGVWAGAGSAVSSPSTGGKSPPPPSYIYLWQRTA